MTETNSEKRFGMVAVEKGFVTIEQVIHALEIQIKENISQGRHRKIGMILFQQGHITLIQIKEVLQELENKRTEIIK